MALTMMKGTIRDTLEAFDYELCRVAQMEPRVSEKHAVIVSTMENGNSFVYHATHTFSVKVVADEERMLKVYFMQSGSPVRGFTVHLHDVFRSIGFRENVLEFLTDGKLPPNKE